MAGHRYCSEHLLRCQEIIGEAPELAKTPLGRET